jgi:hypothetical protein
MLAAFYAMNQAAHFLIPGVITWVLFVMLLIRLAINRMDQSNLIDLID